jgi:chaperone required for assembly of F1-ATPase
MKRFYKSVATAERDGAWTVELDGRPIRTPSRALMTMPSRALAEAVAAEWDAQATEVQPRLMPLTRHANTAVDRVAPQRDHVIDEILAYGGTDLVCYRAEGPTSLVVRQHAAWGPLLDWLEARFGVRLTVTEGIAHVAQAPETLAALRRALAEQGDVELAALHTATTLLGSLVIALALAEGRLDADGAWAAARVDEAFQIERWGEDSEAKARAETMKADLDAAARVLALSAERS